MYEVLILSTNPVFKTDVCSRELKATAGKRRNKPGIFMHAK